MAVCGQTRLHVHRLSLQGDLLLINSNSISAFGGGELMGLSFDINIVLPIQSP